MANKEVLDQINAERIRRTLDMSKVDPICAHDLLGTLVESWLREADLLATSQKKGWQSEAKTLGSAVVLLKQEIAALEKRAAVRTTPREPVTGPSPSWTDPQALDAFVSDMAAEGRGELVADDVSCPTLTVHNTAHEPHTWIGAMNKRYRCYGGKEPMPSANGLAMQLAREMSDATLDGLREPRDTMPLTIGTSYAHDSWCNTIHVPTGDPCPPERVGTDDVAAYLSGAVDELPVTPGANWPNAYSDGGSNEFSMTFVPTGDTAVVERLGTHLATESAVHQQVDQEAPDVHAEPLAPLLREARTPAGPPSRVPPSMVDVTPRTWADLAAPADPSGIPDHLSPSQLSTLDTCPAQARISRYDGAPGIPLWGAVGGTAFHKAVEEIERGELANADKPDVEAIWNTAFHATIMLEINKSGVPMDQWYASASGKENYSWWLVEGGEMLARYFRYRFYGAGRDGRKVLVLPDGRPAIELELTLDVQRTRRDGYTSAVPVKVILDIVWQLPDGSLEIWDHKTRRDYMGPIVDTIQLGTQGHALRNELGVNQPPIAARYFDARKGVLTEAFDPLDKHPLAELEMRYADADDKRRNRPAIPVRSNLCKACPVAYLCPVGSKL